MEERVCPICGLRYRAHPALSRIDNATLVCPECSQREALEAIGVVGKEQDHIVETVRRYTHADEEKDSE